ncbi:GNAT family N-acetyltransferase [Verrucomicrobium sp. BvORR034]|uniref:GNAT family N-acetyltransferase n=1 Tax=Verrucomicrobium sp. BvORR034 TaxID=1396418 RepID=UPI0006786057|nr:GNAT family N-acetyltransferase [Verrucomicrobium sp. BvORR034]
MINFPYPLRLPFQNALTGATYFLVSGDQIEPTPDQLLAIARCANEPLVYDLLFRERFEGEPYQETDAAGWITWTHAGWKDNTHFSFMVQDNAGGVVAACDIKSNDLEGAEMGYWSSTHHRGVMTNAVKLMCQEAAKAGFRALTARTKRGNDKSRAVLQRVGFQDVASPDDERYDHYLLQLDVRS